MEVYHQRTGLLVLILACLFSVLQISRAFVPVSTRVIPVSDTSRSSRPSCSYVGAQSPSTHIEPVTTLEEFEKALEASASTEQVVAVWFQASWCRKCKYIGARLRRIHNHLPADLLDRVLLVSLDVNKVAKVPQQQGIKDLPTIKFYSQGGEVGSYVATDRGEVFYGRLEGFLRRALRTKEG